MRTEPYLAALRRDHPKLTIVYKKDDPFSRAVAGALRVVTLGGQSSYMTRYVTTIGARIYLPTSWDARDDDDKYITLRHEAVHLAQFERLGLVPMALLYLVPLFPLGLALGRARLEWEAYRETLRATAEVKGIAAARSDALAAHIVAQFTGPAYGWMWPFPGVVRGWIARALDEIEASLEPG